MPSPSTFGRIKTARLLLRNFTAADLPIFAAYRNDPDIARYQGWDDYDLIRAQVFFAVQQALSFGQIDSWYQIAIADPSTDLLLGDCVIHFVSGDTTQVEIGYTIAKQNQGLGYAKEAIGALIDFIFAQLHKRRIMAVTDVLNTASIGLLESLGFERTAHYGEGTLFQPDHHSEYLYTLCKKSLV